MSDEIELKLSLAPEAAPGVGRLREVRRRAQGRARRRRLVSTYYDTADLALREAGLALRVRRVGRARVLGVKAAGGSVGGLLVRREWEGPAGRGAPRVEDVADPELRAALARASAGAPLAPVFATEMTRTSRDVELGGGARAVLECDVGAVRVGERREPFAELELELVAGDPAALFDFARELVAALPARLSVESKAARGFRLREGRLPQPVKAAPLALDERAPAADALAAVLVHCLAHVLANVAPVDANDDPEGVHQMRVALRRLRSAFSLFRDVLPADDRARFGGALREAASDLGRARDADVQRAEIVAPVAERLPGEVGLERLLAALDAEREAGRAAARERVRSAAFSDLLLELSAWTARRGWRRVPAGEADELLALPVREFAAHVLERLHGKVLRRARRFAELPTAERHRMRIDVKKLRYASEFFRSLFAGKRARAFAERLEQLQEVLGYANDVAVAHELVARTSAAAGDDADSVRGAALVVGWHESALAAEERRSVRRVARFVDARPYW